MDAANEDRVAILRRISKMEEAAAGFKIGQKGEFNFWIAQNDLRKVDIITEDELLETKQSAK